MNSVRLLVHRRNQPSRCLDGLTSRRRLLVVPPSGGFLDRSAGSMYCPIRVSGFPCLLPQLRCSSWGRLLDKCKRKVNLMGGVRVLFIRRRSADIRLFLSFHCRSDVILRFAAARLCGGERRFFRCWQAIAFEPAGVVHDALPHSFLGPQGMRVRCAHDFRVVGRNEFRLSPAAGPVTGRDSMGPERSLSGGRRLP